MAIENKIISFWKKVKLKSSDMFTLFKVGIGLKFPTHKLHVKDVTDPMKLEGVQSDTSSSTKFLVLDDSDVIKHSNVSGLATADTPNEGEALVYNDSTIVWGHPEKIHLQVRNDEGSTIPAGAPLYSKGEIGGSNRILVGICDADDSAKMPCIGLAEAEMNTTSTKDNFAITQGIYNTNISGFTGLAVGDTLYVDTSGSAPYLTKTKPTGESSLIQNVGIVLKTNSSICQGLQVSAIGRINDVPNLNSGYIFYGNGSNQAVSTQLSTLLPPDLTVDGAGTVHTNNITDLHGAGVDGSANQLLTDDGDGTVTSEAELLFNASTNVLNVGAPGGGSTVYIQRGANDDNIGGRLYFGAGDAGGTDKYGGNLHILAGRGTGNAVGGSIYFQSTAAGSSGSSLNSLANIAELDNVGNLQIDGGLTTGSTSAINSSGLIQVANQSNITGVGTISSGTWQGTAIASAYLDSDTAHLSGAQTFTGDKTFGKSIIQDGNRTVSPGDDGIAIHVDSSDITDGTTSASGTAVTYNHITFENPRLLATNSSVTTTDASTVFIKGQPIASTNQTITNAWALKVAGGPAYFGGTILAASGVTGNVTGSVTGSSGSCTGNAATATALETARTIGGVSFNGTANINLPGVNTSGNQDTSGNAATATSATSAGTAKNIVGNTNDDVTITSDGEVIVKLDSDDDESNQKFKITDNADATVFYVQEDGNVFLAGSTITNSSSDNDLNIESDGNMSFVLDRDNDETSQSFSFKNFNVEIANLDESGNLQIDGDLEVTGNNITNNSTAANFNISSSRVFYLQHAGVYNIQLGNSTNPDVLKVEGDAQEVTINGTLELGHASDTTIARSAAGTVTIEGNTIATTNKWIDAKTASYWSSSTAGFYITLSGASTSENTSLSTASYTLMYVVPYDGKIIRISSFHQSATSGTSTFEMYIDGDDSDLVNDQRGSDMTTSSYGQKFTEDCPADWTFSKGEAIAIKRTDSVAKYGVTMTIVFEYDTTT